MANFNLKIKFFKNNLLTKFFKIAFATEKEETERYLKGNMEVYKYGYKKAVWYGVFNFFANFFVFGSMAVILGLGSKLY